MCSDEGVSFLSSPEIAATLALSAPNHIRDTHDAECSVDIAKQCLIRNPISRAPGFFFYSRKAYMKYNLIE